MLLQEVFESVKSEHARSFSKYGPWQEMSPLEQRMAIWREFCEWQSAALAGDVDGEHGEIREAIQTINVLCRRIMFLTGERCA